ncbi:hypothetical protein GQ55_9G047500 [Panicum hallii var. hallii]|uniref:Uncharacterized protein n=1 Tax=Panicum hallii var. hallii TaxID=1504633 RepID=A0A2T7BZS0_9POAL|nr:hypothetical protein GQ55_9G047500 [Panicum hallii var. hallii]
MGDLLLFSPPADLPSSPPKTASPPAAPLFYELFSAPSSPLANGLARLFPGFGGFIGREVDGEEAGAKRRRPTPTLRRVRKQPHPGRTSTHQKYCKKEQQDCSPYTRRSQWRAWRQQPIQIKKKKGGTEGTETYLRREKNEEGEELEIRPSGRPDQAGKLLLPARAPSSARLLVPPARRKQPLPAPPAGWGGGSETPLGTGLQPSTDNEIASTYQPAVST